jgi:riboflavin biosynthesis pyrimidine reductase
MRALIEPGAEVPSQQPEQRHVDEVELARWYAAPRTPWLRVNMVSTVDGAATGDSGKSGSINNAADKQVFALLRELCDAVVVGAGTARAEGYRPANRPIVLVSRGAAIPETLRDAPAGSVLLATCSAAPGLAEAKALLGEDQVLVLGSHRVDLVDLRRSLVERGLAQLLCEGGPHLLRDLLASRVVDELCATVVPRLVGGLHPRITDGSPLDVPLRLQGLLEHEGTLLARWFVSAHEARHG